MKTKINAGELQDLFHYALALKGQDNAFSAETLKKRLEAGSSAERLLNGLEGAAFFESVIPRPDSWRDEAEMVQAGNDLWNKVVEWAQFHGIDPRTGATTTIHCAVCGKPAMTKQTQCFKHFFGHEIDECVACAGSGKVEAPWPDRGFIDCPNCKPL